MSATFPAEQRVRAGGAGDGNLRLLAVYWCINIRVDYVECCSANECECEYEYESNWHSLSILPILYYSQVSTPTGIISHFVNLQVVVPEAFILGSGELHVDMGSTINLVCIIEKVSLTMLCMQIARAAYAQYFLYFLNLGVSFSPPRAPHHRSTCTGRKTIGWSTTTTRGATSRSRPHRVRAPRAASSYASRKSPTPATTPAPPATPSQQAFTSLYQKVRITGRHSAREWESSARILTAAANFSGQGKRAKERQGDRAMLHVTVACNLHRGASSRPNWIFRDFSI